MSVCARVCHSRSFPFRNVQPKMRSGRYKIPRRVKFNHPKITNMKFPLCLTYRFALFILFSYRNYYPRTMEQRDSAVDFDCFFIGRSFGQRHLDDPKCYNDRKYNHSNGPKEIHSNAAQVYVSIALGMTYLWIFTHFLHTTVPFRTHFRKFWV